VPSIVRGSRSRSKRGAARGCEPGAHGAESGVVNLERRSESAAAPAGEVRAPKSPQQRSRFGRRRAWVLLAVHLAILAHVLQWWLGGSTLSPVEPSEATDLAEHGRINAGAIFFAVAIGSTLLLGRWFCGWACHLVAVQDGCRWILHKLGVRPRPIQLGILGLVPLVAFVYMFLGPWLYRLWQGIALDTHVELYTERFWATFPGVTMSVVTFVVCGLGMVYFLGSKGFCTYACPYGAIFGVVDQLAPQRIRVTDACQGCGQCTVACSSNVRVHQEVRDFGAVVDPGCMKCLDCVAACPNDALYVGFGAPALWTKRRTPQRASESAKPRGAWVRLGLSAAFVLALFAVLISHRQPLAWDQHGGFLAVLAAGSVAIAWMFRGQSTRVGGPNFAEEAFVGVAYLGALSVLRGYKPLGALAPSIVEAAPWAAKLGLEEGIPLLLSLGLAGIVAYGALLALRMASRSEVSLQAIALRRQGHVTRAGWWFSAAMVLVLGVSAHAGVVRGQARQQQREAAEQARKSADAQREFSRGMEALAREQLEEARLAFEAALELDAAHSEAPKRLAGVCFALGRNEDSERYLDAHLARAPGDSDGLFLRGLLAIRRGDRTQAENAWNGVLALDPSHPAAREALATLCEERGDRSAAQEHRAKARP
jgi:polyferredoxin/Tfp pilus assembly protein PilF